MSGTASSIVLGREPLTLDQVAAVACGAGVEVADWSRLDASRAWIEDHVRALASGKESAPVYGVTTGFGSSRSVRLKPADLAEAQANLVRSHAIGATVSPEEHFDDEVVRVAMLLRAAAFLEGRSGVRREIVEALLALLRHDACPLTPLRGSVGASGDLAPLAHLALVLMGEGSATIPDGAGRRVVTGAEVLRACGLAPLRLQAKEGLALLNGTSFSCATLALALGEAHALARTADIACALSLQALGGCARALDPRVHAARRQAGQVDAAASLRALLEGSLWAGATDDPQDNYSLRCAPQVHGASRDALAYATLVCERELGAVTDNPLIFALEGDGEPWDAGAFGANSERHGRPRDLGPAVSAGNFHGQPVAMAADVATLACAEFASISERRLAMLVNPAFSRGLPAHLASRPGVQSGLMIAQYAAASLVSENKTLAHPAVVDSIPTGGGAEDHVPMSTWAARKLRQVVRLSAHVVALELLAAAQAVEWRTVRGEPRAPASSDAPTTEQVAAFESLTVDAAAAGLGAAGGATLRAVRALSDRVVADRPLSDDAARLARAILRGDLVRTVAGSVPVRPLGGGD